MNYLRTALRFWWIVLAGLAAASLVLVLTLYRVKRTWPPVLVTKTAHSYLAQTELLVDSPTGPYIRTAVDKSPVTLVPKTHSSQPSGSGVTTTQTAAAPTKTLVDAANLFPLFVESDAVAQIRSQRFGDVEGTVSARALYASQGVNRYRPSVLPVMQIVAVAKKPQHAIRLAKTTAEAFDIWLTREQVRAKVPTGQRIVVRQLHEPRQAAKQGGTSYGLPALLALVVFGAFLGLIAVIDHLSPRREEELVALTGAGESDEVTHRSLTVASRSHSN